MVRGHMRLVPLLILAFTPAAVMSMEPVAVTVAMTAARHDDELLFLAALAVAPQVRALIERRQSARHLEDAAGRLPDPMLSLGYARKRSPGEQWPMYDVQLEQPFPRWGERDAARAYATSQTRLSDAQVAAEVAQLAGDLAHELAAIAGDRARLAEGEVEERRIGALGRAIAARVASGDAGVTERLGLDTRRERLLLRLDDLRRIIADRESTMRGRLGIAADVDLPPFVAPLPDAIDPRHTPAMADAEAQRQEALAGFQQARAQRHPETAIGLRAEREAAGAGDEDTIGVTVSISLPLARAALTANEEAAQARVRAAYRLAEAARWRAVAAVDSARRAVILAERAARLANGLLVRAEAEQQTLTNALGSGEGGGGLAAAFDLFDRLAELRLDAISAPVAAQQAQAALWTQVIPRLPTAAPGGDRP